MVLRIPCPPIGHKIIKRPERVDHVPNPQDKGTGSGNSLMYSGNFSISALVPGYHVVNSYRQDVARNCGVDVGHGCLSLENVGLSVQ